MEADVAPQRPPGRRRNLLTMSAPTEDAAPQLSCVRGPWQPRPLELPSEAVHTRLDIRGLAGLLDYELDAARESGVRPGWRRPADCWCQVGAAGTIHQVLQRPLAFERVLPALLARGWTSALLPGFMNPDGCARLPERYPDTWAWVWTGEVSAAWCSAGMASPGETSWVRDGDCKSRS